MKRSIAIIAAIVGVLMPAVVFATATPDTQSIVNAYGYGDVLETGDILLIIHYDVDYNSCCPAETAAQALLGRYLDGTTPEKSDAPYVFVNSGYGQGVMSIYFSASEATTASLTHGDADSAEILGNPSFFPSPWNVTKTITWRTQGSQQALEDDVVALANTLEQQTEWSGTNLVATVAGVNKLTTGDGEEYFENSVSNLRLMAPGIFTSSLEQPDFIEEDFDQSYQTTLDNQLTGTRFENFYSNIAGNHGLTETMIQIVVWGSIGLLFMGLVVWKMGQWGIEDSKRMPAGIMVFLVTIAAAAQMGHFPYQLIAALGFLAFAAVGFILFAKRMT